MFCSSTKGKVWQVLGRNRGSGVVSASKKFLRCFKCKEFNCPFKRPRLQKKVHKERGPIFFGTSTILSASDPAKWEVHMRSLFLSMCSSQDGSIMGMSSLCMKPTFRCYSNSCSTTYCGCMPPCFSQRQHHWPHVVDLNKANLSISIVDIKLGRLLN